jgi:predicted AAA+ superfamily ATPase
MIRDEAELERLLEILALRTGNLLNISRLSKDLGMQRETIEKYITILERLFLIRRLPAWHKNQSRRLIKAPKVHIVDSGLASSLCNLKTTDWFNFGKEFGPVLESFVMQQLTCQAGWSEHDLRFSHYRDKDQVEVDLVIEHCQSIWGVEVKKATSIQNKDGTGLSRLAAIAGESWRGGILLYTGSHCLPLNHVENSYAVPMHWLWSLGYGRPF